MAAASKDKFDRMRYFAKDGPVWRLAALLIERLPAILAAAGVLVASLYGAARVATW